MGETINSVKQKPGFVGLTQRAGLNLVYIWQGKTSLFVYIDMGDIIKKLLI